MIGEAYRLFPLSPLSQFLPWQDVLLLCEAMTNQLHN